MPVLIAILLVVAIVVGYAALRRVGIAGPLPGRSLSGVVVVVLVLFALSRCVTTIPAGHVGVVDVFGQVSPTTLKSGIQFVNPLARVVKMSVQTQEIKETMDVPSQEGLAVQIEVSVLFHLNPDKAQEVYRSVGEDYVPILLEPQFRSVTRGVTAGFEAKALYTSQREHLAEVIATDLRKFVEGRGVTIEATPMRRLQLPARLASAIEEKLSADQESQRMQFVLLKEKQEAERKRIEAEGVSDFQKIVSQGISDNLLRWKGIEATLKISESPNTKVVIIGAGKDGMPVILGDK
jgi:prohibitin 1